MRTNSIIFGPEVEALHRKIMQEFDFTSEPILFIPCSKSRPYSRSMSHSFMSAVTHDNTVIKVVISDLLGPVPYDFELLVPDYDIHPDDLKGPLRETVVAFLRAFLTKLQTEKIFYLGGKSHLKLLREANESIGKTLLAMVPKRGIVDYANYAKKMKTKILGGDMVE